MLAFELRKSVYETNYQKYYLSDVDATALYGQCTSGGLIEKFHRIEVTSKALRKPRRAFLICAMFF